jgi:hypothetical protein
MSSADFDTMVELVELRAKVKALRTLLKQQRIYGNGGWTHLTDEQIDRMLDLALGVER